MKNRGRFTDLFQEGRRKLTTFVWILWFVAASGYYGVVLMSTELLNSNQDYCGHSEYSNVKHMNNFPNFANNGSSDTQSCSLECKYVNSFIASILHFYLIKHTKFEWNIDLNLIYFFSGLTTHDYVTLIWTTLAEFPGVILAIFLIDTIGRRNTLRILFAIFTISVLLMLACSISRTYLMVMLFCARGTTAGVFQVVYLYTPEVYPTNLRSVAFGKNKYICVRDVPVGRKVF